MTRHHRERTPPAPQAPTVPRITRRKLVMVTLAFALAFVALTPLDPRITRALFYPEHRHDWWWQAVKTAGDVRFWGVFALIALPITRDWRWAGAPVAAAAIAGLVAEGLKLLIGRERPVRDFVIQNDAHYVFKPLFHALTDGSNLGLPSSHAATVFGAATMIAILVPRPSSPLVIATLLLAIACALSRILAGAHFATDTLAGAYVGYLAAHTLAHASDTMTQRKISRRSP